MHRQVCLRLSSSQVFDTLFPHFLLIMFLVNIDTLDTLNFFTQRSYNKTSNVANNLLYVFRCPIYYSLYKSNCPIMIYSSSLLFSVSLSSSSSFLKEGTVSLIYIYDEEHDVTLIFPSRAQFPDDADLSFSWHHLSSYHRCIRTSLKNNSI